MSYVEGCAKYHRCKQSGLHECLSCLSAYCDTIRLTEAVRKAITHETLSDFVLRTAACREVLAEATPEA